MIARLLTALPFALFAAIGSAQPPVTVELHHRSAESLITVLRPLVGAAALSGAGTRMQVRGSPDETARAVRLIRESDRPLQPLRVALSDQQPTGASADEPPARGGSVTLSTGRPLPPDRYGNGQTLSTRADPPPAPVLEGDPLLFSMPAPQSLWFAVNGARPRPKAAGGAAAASAGPPPDVAGVVHFDAVSQFTVRIWLAAETVAIDLQPRAAGTVGSAADAGSGHATVYGRVGQWITLADAGAELPSPYSGASGAPRAGLWIKVELAQ